MAHREMDTGSYLPKPNELEKKFPSNSYSKEEPEQKEIKQVTTAKVRKQNALQRLGKAIVEDSIENAKERAFGDIIVPGFKTLIFDTFTEILSIMLFNESGGAYRPRTGAPKRGDRTSYRSYYDKGVKKYETHDIPFDPDTIIVSTLSEAHQVLDELANIISTYGQASVAEYYDIVGISSNWTDNRYGWTNIHSASIKPVRDGFELIMPRPHVLED